MARNDHRIEELWNYVGLLEDKIEGLISIVGIDGKKLDELVRCNTNSGNKSGDETNVRDSDRDANP